MSALPSCYARAAYEALAARYPDTLPSWHDLAPAARADWGAIAAAAIDSYRGGHRAATRRGQAQALVEGRVGRPREIDRKAVKRLAKQGLSSRQIAERLGKSAGGVQHVLRELGLGHEHKR